MLKSLQYIRIHQVPLSTLPMMQGKCEDAETFRSPSMEITEEDDDEDHPNVSTPRQSGRDSGEACKGRDVVVPFVPM